MLSALPSWLAVAILTAAGGVLSALAAGAFLALPEQAPVQVEKVDPLPATAVRVTVVPAAYSPLQVLPQEMPLGVEDTVPLPLIATLSTMPSMVPVPEPKGTALPPPQATARPHRPVSIAIRAARRTGRACRAATGGMAYVFME